MVWVILLLSSLLIHFYAPKRFKPWIYFVFMLLGIAITYVDKLFKGFNEVKAKQINTNDRSNQDINLDFISIRNENRTNLPSNQNVPLIFQYNFDQNQILAPELPRYNYNFIGRENEQKLLMNYLAPGRHVSVTGPGGIGKSSLVAQVLWQISPDENPPEKFPDGIIYYSFYEPNSCEENALRHIALHFDETIIQSNHNAVRRALAGKKALIVLESAEAADNIYNIIENSGRCGILIVSRDRKSIIDGNFWIDLDPLPHKQATELLFRLGGECIDDPLSAKLLSELLGGLPLALDLTARRMVTEDVTATEILEDYRISNLSALNWGDRQRESIQIMLDKSTSHLDNFSKKVLGTFAHFGFSYISIDQIISILKPPFQLGDSKEFVKSKLRILIRYGLVKRSDDNKYRVTHKLILDYARDFMSKSIDIEKIQIPIDRFPKFQNILYSALRETHRFEYAELSKLPIINFSVIGKTIATLSEATPNQVGRVIFEWISSEIEKLRPDGEPEIHNTDWRHYLILKKFYIEGMSVNQVLQVVELPIYRFHDFHTSAVSILASSIWNQDRTLQTKNSAKIITNLNENEWKYINTRLPNYSKNNIELVDSIINDMQTGRAWVIALVGDDRKYISQTAFEISKRCVEENLFKAIIGIRLEVENFNKYKNSTFQTMQYSHLDGILNTIGIEFGEQDIHDKLLGEKFNVLHDEMKRNPTLLIIDRLEYLDKQDWLNLGLFLERLPTKSYAIITSCNKPNIGEKIYTL